MHNNIESGENIKYRFLGFSKLFSTFNLYKIHLFIKTLGSEGNVPMYYRDESVS